MAPSSDSSGRLPGAFLTPGTSSFADFLASYSPEMLPGRRVLPSAPGVGEVPHGTTIVVAAFDGGIVMAGDRRSTMGNLIAQREAEKVFPADEFSCIGYAGAAGIGFEVVRLFQVELEHYEKMEGRSLSLEGKANRLGTMIRANLGMALQGLAFLPLFAGYDEERDGGRIFSYDVTGGRSEERGYHAVGSGSVFARGALKKLYRDDFNEDDAVLTCVHAIYDAAEDDSATGGPDLGRKIYPVVAVVGTDGYRQLSDEDVGRVVQGVVDERMTRPDGPAAPLR
ncbi:MAG: proteasome subunit beta [Streptosporangiales bacterium]|nr:proteasome subunit beta [Streptosporangiales bacterium]